MPNILIPVIGADSRIRTDDLIITNDLLYQLSYIGVPGFCEWDHILAIPATLCFPNDTVKICYRILNVAGPQPLRAEN
jgi:hypothetical protein